MKKKGDEKKIGQRLIIQIVYEDEALAAAYYHWSGYTGSALDIVSKCLSAYKTLNDLSPEEKAIKMLGATGAGLAGETSILEYCKYKFLNPNFVNIKPATDRNLGLIGISQEDIDENIRWGEEFVTISLDKETVDFGVCYELYEEDMEECEDDELESLETISFDSTEDIAFDDFDDFAGEVGSAGNYFKLKDGTVIGKVE